MEDQELLTILNYLLEQSTQEPQLPQSKNTKIPSHDYQYIEQDQFQNLLEDIKLKYTKVTEMSEKSFALFLENNSNRHDKASQLQQQNCNLQQKVRDMLINSCCSPKVIQLIYLELKQKYEKYKENQNL